MRRNRCPLAERTEEKLVRTCERSIREVSIRKLPQLYSIYRDDVFWFEQDTFLGRLENGKGD